MNINVKTLKLIYGENFGKRLKDCRKWKGLKQSDVVKGNITRQTFSNLENGENILLSSFIEYNKGLKIRNVQIKISEIGRNLSVTLDNYQQKFKEFREGKHLTRHDIFKSAASVYNIEENKTKDIKMDTFLAYAQSLGIKILTINIIK